MNKIRVSKILSNIVSLAGLAVMLAWIFDIDVLKRILAGYISMKFTTALSFVASGVVVYFIARYHSEKSIHSLIFVYVASLCIFIAMGTFFIGSIIDARTGLEDLFIREQPNSQGVLFSGRPSVATMINFLLISISGFLFLLFRRFWGIFIISGSIVALIGGIAMVGYVINEPALYYRITGFSNPIAIPTLFLFIIVGISLILAGYEDKSQKMLQGQANVKGCKSEKIGYESIYILVVLTLSIFAVEGLIMLFLNCFLPKNYSIITSVLVDSLLLIILLYPIIVLFVVMPFLKEISNRKKSEKESRLFGEIMKSMAEGVYFVGADDGIIKYCNPKFENMFGYDPGEMLEKHVSIVNAPSDKGSKETAREIMGILSTTGEWHGEVHNIKKNGTVFWCYANCSIFQHPVYGRVIIAVHSDITERKKAEKELEESEGRLRTIFKDARDGILLADAETKKFSICNEAICNMLGYTKEELLRLSVNNIHPERELPQVIDIFEKQAKGELKLAENLPVKRKDGSVFYADVNTSPIVLSGRKYLMGNFRDITERKKAEKKLKDQFAALKHLATYDSLTRIANRYTFEKSANLIFQTAKRYNRKFAILEVDIDNFKWINDQYGHDTGDKVLQSMASIINQNIREGDLLARLGGDEFGIALVEIETVEDAGVVADKIVRLFSKPLDINGNLILCSVSVGIACYPSDDIDNFDTLLKQADIAMYRAKEKGRSCFDFFSNEVRAEYYKKQELEYVLKDALKTNKFYLLYQPIVDMRNNKIIGLEALLRMPENPKLGVITPSVFIYVSEKLNLIQDIGFWVFDKVCDDIKGWMEKGVKEMFYSVNVSPKQIDMENFYSHFKSVLSEFAVDPKLIELEITETIFGADTIHIDEWLKIFKKLNVKLSIDDFGTGYSSLSRLGVLPINTIKIDGSFVRDIGKSEKHNSIIKNIILLSESLSVKVIAECVETKEQVDFLLENGCNLAQGFYFYKPIPVDEITEILCKNSKQ